MIPYDRRSDKCIIYGVKYLHVDVVGTFITLSVNRWRKRGLCDDIVLTEVVKCRHIFVYGKCLYKCLIESDQEILGYHQVYILFVVIL